MISTKGNKNIRQKLTESEKVELKTSRIISFVERFICNTIKEAYSYEKKKNKQLIQLKETNKRYYKQIKSSHYFIFNCEALDEIVFLLRGHTGFLRKVRRLIKGVDSNDKKIYTNSKRDTSVFKNM